MPDSTHHDGDDGFHEIQLSGKQLVFLFMATTVVAVVIFLCGVQVGRNVRADRAPDVDALAAASGAQTPAQAPPAVSAPRPADEPPPPVKDTDEGLSYAKRLQSGSAPKEQLKPQGQTPSTPSTPQPARASAPPQKSLAAPLAAPPPSPPASHRSPDAEPAPGTPHPGNWVIQVHALKDRGAAEGIAKSLIAKGYPAFVLDPDPGAPAIYRVQVGRYPDRHDAEQIARKLEANEHYKPIIHGAR